MAAGYQALVRERNLLNVKIRDHQTVCVRSFIAVNKHQMEPRLLKVYEKLESEMRKVNRDVGLIDHYIELIMSEIEG